MTLRALWSELRGYPRGVIEEMKKVSWPSAATARQQTTVVIAIVAVATLIIGAMDAVFSRLAALIIGA